jgi:hypothetical protein
MIAILLVVQWLFSVSLLSLRTKIGQTARKNNNAHKKTEKSLCSLIFCAVSAKIARHLSSGNSK